MDLNTFEALNNLTDECVAALQKIGSTAKTVAEIVVNKKDPVYEVLNSGE